MSVDSMRFVVALTTILPCAMGSLLAQDTRTQVDPMTVQKSIVDNRDFDVASLWRGLGIAAQLDTVDRKIGVNPFNSNTTFENCSGDCVPEISRANLDADPGEELVLKVYQRWGFCRFLIFKRLGSPGAGPDQWRFLGHADHDFARYYMPDYRVAVLDGKRYFVMAAQGVSGTGVSLQYDRWYEMAPAGMHEIVNLPASGSECPNLRSLCREFTSKCFGTSRHSTGRKACCEFHCSVYGQLLSRE